MGDIFFLIVKFLLFFFGVLVVLLPILIFILKH